jgi:hypothetical protein
MSISIINNHVDATLLQLLAAVCIRRDFAHATEAMAQRPFNHILGVLGRNTIAAALKDDGWELPRFRLQIHEEWAEKFKNDRWERDHVFPLDRWKALMLGAARKEEWRVDERGLNRIKAFVEEHYVIASIPETLHRTLDNRAMPDDWRYTGAASLWARYTTAKVKALMGRPLVLPHEGETDFVREAY